MIKQVKSEQTATVVVQNLHLAMSIEFSPVLKIRVCGCSQKWGEQNTVKPMFSQIMTTCIYNTDRPADIFSHMRLQRAHLPFWPPSAEGLLRASWVSSQRGSAVALSQTTRQIVRTAKKTIGVSFPSVVASTTYAACARPEVLWMINNTLHA